MADVQSVIKDSQCDPKIYQAGNYQSIHHPVKLGHRSIIDESKQTDQVRWTFPQVQVRYPTLKFVSSYILPWPSKRLWARLRGCEAVISAVIGRLTQRQAAAVAGLTNRRVLVLSDF